MTRRQWSVALAAIAISPAPLLRADRQSDAVDHLLANYARSGEPGCGLGVLLRGRIVYANAVGFADVESRRPLATSTPVYVASIAKQFTAAAIYRLAGENRLRLSDSVRRYVPALPSYADAITIQHLLNHTSGLRDTNAMQEVAGTLDQVLDTDGDVALLVRQRALNFAPGTDYEYSNPEYVLLSLVVERASGMPLSAYAQRHLFSPSGMANSQFQSANQEPGMWASGYEMRNGSFQKGGPLPVTTGDGGMISSIDDLLRWNMHLDAPRPGAAKWMRLLQTPARLASGEVIPHASGLFVGEYKGLTTVSHNGVALGYQTDMVRFPKQHLAIVCLCNRGDINATKLTRAVADIYLRGVLRELPRSGQKPAANNVASLAGTWESKQGFLMTLGGAPNLKLSLAGSEYSMASGRRGEFFNDSEGVRLVLRTIDANALELKWEGGRPTVYRRLVGRAPQPNELARYAVELINEETGSRLTMVVADQQLFLTTKAGWRIPLQSAAPDRFIVGPYVLEFVAETPGQRISGMRLHRERLWDLRFARIPD